MGDREVLAVIPARRASSRLPDKVLVDLGGWPLVRWVWEQARMARRIDRVVIAVDDDEVAACCRAFGAEVCPTSVDHASGTDRIAEVAAQGAADIVLSVQADEPFMDPHTLDALVDALDRDREIGIATPVCRLMDPASFLDPSVVKVVFDERGRALYFSRAPIPWPRDEATAAQGPAPVGAWRHLGVYAYRRDALFAFAATPPGTLERIERLEQLRALARGMPIGTVVVSEPVGPGVDTPDDLRVARALVARGIRAPGRSTASGSALPVAD